jgi:hypothetical protein
MEVNIDVEQVYTVVALLVAMATLGTLVRLWIKHHVNDIVNEMKTGNGLTLGQYVVKVNTNLDQLTKTSDENRTLIDKSAVDIRSVRDELIEHRIKGH